MWRLHLHSQHSPDFSSLTPDYPFYNGHTATGTGKFRGFVQALKGLAIESDG
jgi:hypothetical protein